MTAPLGPCPVCGGTESEMRMVEWTELRKCTVRKCQHICRVEHWSLLRRKMTREECAVMMKPLTSRMYYDDEPETNACFAAICAALTGEKT